MNRLEIELDREDLAPCGLPTKNTYHAIGKRRRYVTKKGIEFRYVLARVCHHAGLTTGEVEHPPHDCPVIDSGLWRLDLDVGQNRRSHALDGEQGHLDSDACLSPVRDALQWVGILDDDMRIREDHTRVSYDKKDGPWVRIVLTRLVG